MTRVDKRSITLSPELAAEVDGAVAAGEYASASEVVREALRQWKERRDLFGYTLEELRVLVQEGIESGPDRRSWIACAPNIRLCRIARLLADDLLSSSPPRRTLNRSATIWRSVAPLPRPIWSKLSMRNGCI